MSLAKQETGFRVWVGRKPVVQSPANCNQGGTYLLFNTTIWGVMVLKFKTEQEKGYWLGTTVSTPPFWVWPPFRNVARMGAGSSSTTARCHRHCKAPSQPGRLAAVLTVAAVCVCVCAFWRCKSLTDCCLFGGAEV